MNDINEIVKRLQACYHASGLSYADLARRTGLPKSALQRYVSGTTEKIPMDRLAKLAYAFDTTPQELMGWDPSPEDGVPKGFVPLPHMNRIPLVGRIACGTPITAEENIEDYFPFPAERMPNKQTFLLKVKGESMINAGILDGDYVLVEQDATASNGDMVVALVEDSATVKTFYKEEGVFRLQPENDFMDPIIVKEVSILGKVIGVMRFFK